MCVWSRTRLKPLSESTRSAVLSPFFCHSRRGPLLSFFVLPGDRWPTPGYLYNFWCLLLVMMLLMLFATSMSSSVASDLDNCVPCCASAERSILVTMSADELSNSRLEEASPHHCRSRHSSRRDQTQTGEATSRGINRDFTYAHPVGVTTPNAQSPPSLATTWLSKTGVMTTPALASDTHRARMAAVNFILIVVGRGSEEEFASDW